MLSIVVPVYNGEKNLGQLFKRLAEAAESLDTDVELLFVDDGSTDGSLEAIKKLSAQPCNPLVNGASGGSGLKTGWVSLRRNAGQQLAVLCGLRRSRGDYIVTIDDDLEHPPEIIPALFARASAGSDAVYAVPMLRSGRGTSFFRRTGAVMRDLFFSVFLGKPRGLRISSFRIFSRAAVDAISQAGQSFVYISAELFRAGFTAEAVEYDPVSPGEPSSASGRYSAVSRIRLYFRLLRWYGPFGSRKAGCQYEIAATGGCL